jgi:hypothetical protein
LLFTHLTIVVSLLDKGLTLAEAEDMGGSLVLVASQEARAKAVLGDKYDPIQVKNIGKKDSVCWGSGSGCAGSACIWAFWIRIH